jgi:hypothetical protein
MASSVIVKNREILGGVLVFAGTRSPFQVLPDYIAAGQTLDANRELLRLAQNWFALVSRLLRDCPANRILQI